MYLSTGTSVRTGCHCLICPSVCLSKCVTFVLFTDCESCLRPISSNPGSMEALEYGLTRETWFVACRLEVVAVAGLLRIRGEFRVRRNLFRVFFRFVFFERARPAAIMRPPCLIFLSTSTAVRTGYDYLIRLSVCESVSVCATFVGFADCESCTRPSSTNPGSMEAGEYELTRRTCLVARRLEVVTVAMFPAYFRGVFLGAAGFRVFCSFFWHWVKRQG